MQQRYNFSKEDDGADEEVAEVVEIYNEVETKLDIMRSTEENEDLLNDITKTIGQIKDSYEKTEKVADWNEVFQDLLDKVLGPLEDEDIEASDANWPDVKYALQRLANGK